ncbi:squalene/phytoene synthase family protein [Paracoccus sanguinis]|uniref:squalene/phytoene synthase family protein n=1 Tax=Paracoccus sanguinis TaxID=1545044 RepID=UPI00051FB26F|nr:squalene/phytoene synthase family protein [Paracoccus sanguinis]KGJ15244.1 hypothetical protein IX54_02845 [Paracoccus sanguinis]
MSGAEALIAGLRQTDPDRLAMALLAPRPARLRLLGLYALNDELARTALAAREPLVAEMRVRWWADRLAAMADGPPPPHALLDALWAGWGREAATLAPLAEARMHDAARLPHPDVEAVVAYADATGGALMERAGAAFGAGEPAVFRDQGRGAGLVAWLRARPALAALGLALPGPDPAALPALAQAAREAFASARGQRRRVPRGAHAVLFPGAAVGAALRSAAAGSDPAGPSEFARRAALARLALTGRWWI